MCRWIVDADQIQLDDFENDILYHNKIVDSYLNNDRILGIEAPKGLGKTFLIKCKRMKSQEKGVKCLPIDSMCDILDKITLEESMNVYLNDYANWIDLWKISICLAIIKSGSVSEVEYNEFKGLVKEQDNELLDELLNSRIIVTPCQIMNHLINSKRMFIRDLQGFIPTLVATIKTINHPVHIFIDKTDQALRDNIHFISGATSASRGPNNNSYWSYGQVALGEAAYNIFTQNAHIKVYFSIRSEALMGAESYTNLFLQIRSYVIKLEYEFSELKKMFEHYISVEDDQHLVIPELKATNKAKAFVGVESLTHGYVKKYDGQYEVESFFEYLFRHTLKRPRDIMHICCRLCYSSIKEKTNYDERCSIIRHIINKESRFILHAYLRERGPFVFDKNQEQWNQFWSAVEKNVFTIQYIKAICSDINKSTTQKKIVCNNNCRECKDFKPFSSLYNTGLLGVIAKNNVETELNKIHFQSSGDTIINTDENLLPASELYFLHPMLTNKIESCRQGDGLNFDICKELIVGYNKNVSEKNIISINRKETELLNRINTNSIFLSSTCFDLNDYRKMIFKELRNHDYSVIMSERNDFGTPEPDVHSHDYCLDIVKKCKKMIFIIGSNYGGEYIGSEYTTEANEINQLNKKLEKPSISLMEFYIAHKNKIKTYVFVRRDIYNERAAYKKNIENYRPTFVKDNRVFEIISFITQLPKGNWIKTFEDLEDLSEMIRIEFDSPKHLFDNSNKEGENVGS